MAKLTQNRAWLSAIILHCPFGTPLESCLLAVVRQLPPEKRMAFVERIRPGHVERLLEQHRVCLLVREAVEQRPGLFDPCSMESKLRSCPQKMKDLGLKTSRDKHLP